MPRWEHEVCVHPGATVTVMLVCSCGWKSRLMTSPTVSRLTEIAREHRRDTERCAYMWADERCPMPAGHTGRHIFDDDEIRSRSR